MVKDIVLNTYDFGCESVTCQYHKVFDTCEKMQNYWRIMDGKIHVLCWSLKELYFNNVCEILEWGQNKHNKEKKYGRSKNN